MGISGVEGISHGCRLEAFIKSIRLEQKIAAVGCTTTTAQTLNAIYQNMEPLLHHITQIVISWGNTTGLSPYIQTCGFFLGKFYVHIPKILPTHTLKILVYEKTNIPPPSKTSPHPFLLPQPSAPFLNLHFYLIILVSYYESTHPTPQINYNRWVNLFSKIRMLSQEDKNKFKKITSTIKFKLSVYPLGKVNMKMQMCKIILIRRFWRQ